MLTASQPSEPEPLPAGLLVMAPPDEIARCFDALCALQPVRHTPQGLLCAPRAAPELATSAIAGCPLPLQAVGTVPGWPDPPSDHVSGWYRRSPDHAHAPAGVPELVQVPGEGFGQDGHATTAMCLAHMSHMPEGPALDAGCGSGLLAQAWAKSGRGPVVGYDIDPRALDHAVRSLRASGIDDGIVRMHRSPLESLTAADVAGRVLLANIPASAHHVLLGRFTDAPPGAVLSGLRPGQTPSVVEAYRRLGMRVVRASSAGGFHAVSLVRR